MKELYNAPKAEVITFVSADVLAAEETISTTAFKLVDLKLPFAETEK